MDRRGPALVVAPLKDEADAVCRRLGESGFPANPAQIGALTCSVIPTLDMIIEIRVVTDAADETAAGSFHANLDRVMPRVADLLGAWRSTLSERGEPLGL